MSLRARLRTLDDRLLPRSRRARGPWWAGLGVVLVCGGGAGFGYALAVGAPNAEFMSTGISLAVGLLTGVSFRIVSRRDGRSVDGGGGRRASP